MNTRTLVDAITCTVPLSPRVIQAFAQVDRALFVQAYYQHDGATWTLEPAGHTVYEDKALVTQVINDLPTSSSSQPSIMALMLDALDIQPGQRVLEIGTGTGYTAALLAVLVGEQGQVVTVDIDETLSCSATEHLERAGYANRVRTLWGDGYEGVMDEAPFDRIIITAGFRALSPAWVEQLRPSGILVGNRRGKMASVLLRLCKNRAGQLQGHLLPKRAWNLHGRDYPMITAPDWQRFDANPSQRVTVSRDLVQALDDPAFLFFLEGQCPEMEYVLRARGIPERHAIYKVFLEGEGMAMLCPDGGVETQGETWERMTQMYMRYHLLHTPALETYRLVSVATLERPWLYAQIPGACWRL